MQKLAPGSKKIGDAHTCKLCAKEYIRKEVTSSPTYCLNCLRHKHKWAAKALAIDYKGGCCTVCGYCRCSAALEFHHINPEEKELELTTKTLSTYSLDTIEQELRKCVLLCANCHRELHAALEAVDREEEPSPIIQQVEDSHKIWSETPTCFPNRYKWYDHHPKFKEINNQQ